MNFLGAAVLIAVAFTTVSCSEKSTPNDRSNANTSETPRQPPRLAEGEYPKAKAELPPVSDRKIGTDCVAFVRSTKVVPARAARADCPGCPVEGTEVFSVRGVKTDAVTCSVDTCNVGVTVRAVFNPAAGEAMAGGLTAWISPEQRSAYLNGQTPEGVQEFRVNVTYKRDGPEWRVVEFERPAAE